MGLDKGLWGLSGREDFKGAKGDMEERKREMCM